MATADPVIINLTDSDDDNTQAGPAKKRQRSIKPEPDTDRHESRTHEQIRAEFLQEFRTSDDVSFEIQYELAPQVNALIVSQSLSGGGLDRLLAGGEVVYDIGVQRVVIKLTQEVIVKAIADFDDTTEYSSLQYLRDNIPSVPAPRPLGLIRFGKKALLFQSCIAGSRLSLLANKPTVAERLEIKDQLSDILDSMRAAKLEHGIQWGSVGGEGCKVSGRYRYPGQPPILTSDEFDALFLSGRADKVNLFGRLGPYTASECRFSHGSLRWRNIMAKRDDDGHLQITGIVGWETSGFYPAWWECVRADSYAADPTRLDWINHLPESIAPWNHRERWMMYQAAENF